jgi:hypothetical protein
MEQVTFESDSRLTEIQPRAFGECSSLVSICIPALVECIPDECFAKCKSLSTLSFEPGAKLNRIDGGAFVECNSLHHFTIPGQLKILDPGAFRGAASLTGLGFEMPSRIKRLCLPRVCIEHLCIPDSVEFLSGMFETVGGHGPLLEFGRGSRLMEIEFADGKCDRFYRANPDRRPQIFVRLSEEVLRQFRFKFEVL